MTRVPVEFWRFTKESLLLVSRGSGLYLAWVALLLLMIAAGAFGYWNQIRFGLITANVRDPVSWGFYIGNFAFLVGVAAAAVLLVIPAYVYHWKPIKELVILGELLAIAALAIIGDRSQPVNGNSTPAATGIPIVL